MSNSGGFKILKPKNVNPDSTPCDVSDYITSKVGGTDLFEGDDTRIVAPPKKYDTNKKSN